MQDPLSRVASWLTQTTAETHPLPADDADPVLGLIAEEDRLETLAIEAQARGDEIFLALPEDIRKPRFDREIGFDQALAQLRAGLEEIETIREASGCEAHYREARDIEAQASVVADRIRETKPTSLAGAIAMLEWDNEIEDSRGINAVIAGLRGLLSPASRGGADPIVARKAELDRLQAEIARIPEAGLEEADAQVLANRTCDLESKILEAVAIYCRAHRANRGVSRLRERPRVRWLRSPDRRSSEHRSACRHPLELAEVTSG